MKNTTITFINRCLHSLMRGSDLADEEIQRPSLAYIRELIYRGCSILLPLGTLAGLPLALKIQPLSSIVFELICSVISLIAAWQVLTRNRHIIPLVYLVSMGAACLVAMVMAGNTTVIYFGYAFVIAFYLMPTRRQILTANLVWFLMFSALSVNYLNAAEAVSIALTYIVLWLLTEIMFSVAFYSEMELRDLAVRDPLTNVFNRRVLEDNLHNAIHLRDRYDIVTSIIMLDIDHFKQINDTYGHDKGDQVLKVLATFLTEHLRSSDIICRYGGEEFVVVMMNTRGKQALSVAQSLCQGVAEYGATTDLSFTVSCGVAESKQHDSVQSWFKRCDAALYRAKQDGRNRVEAELIAH